MKIRTQLNYNYSTSVQDVYNASNTSQEAHDMNGIAQMNNTLSQDVLSETYVTFQRTFADRHNLSVMAGHSFDYNMGRTLGTTAYDFVNDALGNENMGAGNPQKNVINNTYQNSKLLSFYGRLNYVLDDKYLFTFTMRADGSSKFGKNNKWGYFPSGAVSWKLHNEPWMQKLNVFDEFKIRASWGISGNQGISPYQTLNRYGTEKYWFADKWQTAIGPGYEAGREGANDRYILWGGIANPDLRWESTRQWNLGVDLAFFKRRLRVTMDYYDKYTTDLLREKYLPLSSSYDKMWVNDGNIRNRGFELTLDGDIVSRKNTSFSATFIFSRNRNEVTDLGNAVSSGLSHGHAVRGLRPVAVDVQRQSERLCHRLSDVCLLRLPGERYHPAGRGPWLHEFRRQGPARRGGHAGRKKSAQRRQNAAECQKYSGICRCRGA